MHTYTTKHIMYGGNETWKYEAHFGEIIWDK